jgi:hypothetical protein
MTLENDYKLTSQELYQRFISSLPSEVTKEYYHRWLHYFMDWLHIDRKEYDKLLDYDPRKLQYRGQRLLAFKMGKYYSIFQNKKQKDYSRGNILDISIDTQI